ncbi:hypothetical protein NH340_JMT04445 [Sarcoptes scabiei]|nr:hypothetical protein NH340_JMT04445 [Sarcoptes scabiei]
MQQRSTEDSIPFPIELFKNHNTNRRLDSKEYNNQGDDEERSTQLRSPQQTTSTTWISHTDSTVTDENDQGNRLYSNDFHSKTKNNAIEIEDDIKNRNNNEKSFRENSPQFVSSSNHQTERLPLDSSPAKTSKIDYLGFIHETKTPFLSNKQSKKLNELSSPSSSTFETILDGNNNGDQNLDQQSYGLASSKEFQNDQLSINSASRLTTRSPSMMISSSNNKDSLPDPKKIRIRLNELLQKHRLKLLNHFAPSSGVEANLPIDYYRMMVKRSLLV